MTHAINGQSNVGQHHLHHPLSDAAQHLRRIAIVIGAFEHVRQILAAFLPDIGRKQRRLAVEMIVQRALGHAGDRGDPSHARPFVAVGCKH